MDKLKAIFQDYQEAKLLSKQTTFEQFASVDDSIKEVLYNQGIENKVISSKTDLELFKSAWAEAAIPEVKKKGMVLPSEDGSLDSSETDVISQEDFLQQTVTPSDQLETKPTDTQVDFELGFQNIPEQQLTEKFVSTPSEEKDDFAGTILSEQPPKAFSEPVVQDGVSVAEEVEYDPFKESVDRVVNKELLTNDLSSFLMPLFSIFTRPDATEENVIPQMQYYFGEYGFKFEPADALGDGMTVKATNGKQTYVNLDGVFGGEQAAKDLKKFLIENKEENAIERESNKVIEKNRKIYKEQEIKDAVSVFDTEAQEFHNNYVEFIKLKESNELMSKELLGMSQSDIDMNPNMKQKFDNYNQNLAAEKQLLKIVTEKSEEFKVKGARLDMLAGEYYEMKSKQGSYSSGIMAGIFGRGPANIASGAVSYGVDAYTYLAKNRSLTEEKYKDELIRIGKEEGYLPKDEDFSGVSKEEIIERLGGDTNDAKPFFDGIFLAGKQALGFDPIGREKEKEALGEPTNFDKVNDKVKDYARKGIKYYNDYGVEGLDYDKAVEGKYRNPFSQIAANLDTEMGIVDASLASGEKISENIGAPKEWADLEKQGFWGGAILGLSESIPAMIGGMDKIGFAQRTAQMFMMTSSHLEQEMNKNPKFDNISESEKLPMKVGLATVVAVLESIGFRNVMSKNAYIPTLILSRVLKKVPKGSTQKTLRQYIQQDVESAIARGGYSLLAAGSAEFETGFAQEAADILIKNIYNDFKEKEMFETPESWGDIVFQMVYAGGQEAVGGFILGSPGAIASAVAGRQDVQSLDERDWKNFELLSNDPTYDKMYVQKLKAEIADPENSKTLEEAQAELDSVRKIQGLLKNNKQNISNLSAEKKKRAVQLLIQQQKLKEEIDNGNKQLSKSKRELLDEVNKELENLGVESRLIEISERAKEGGIQEFKGSVIDWIKGLGKTKDIGDVMEGGIEIDMDGTKVIMTESEGGVTLESIETPDADKGKGKAEAALKKIADNADRDGVKITLKVVPKDATVDAGTTQQNSVAEDRQKNLSERSNSVKKQFGEEYSSKELPYNKGNNGKGRAKIYDITKPDEKGVVTAQYVNPETGSVDVIISGKNDNNFVGYTRVYENGKPTNMFTGKLESTESGLFKGMITSAENTLPANAAVVETTTISEGGLRTYKKSRLVEKVDSDGNVVTRPTKYSDATKQSVEKAGDAAYNPFKTTDKYSAEAEIAKIEEAYPGIIANIIEKKGPPPPPALPGKTAKKRGVEYTISIDLPVLVKPTPIQTDVNIDTEVATDWRQKKVNGKPKTVDAGRLENLYGRNGFEMQEDGVTMVRTPKVQELTQEQKDIEEFFAEDADDDVDRASDNLSINRKNEGESQSSIYRASAITSAKFAAKAIKKILPDVRIILHESESEYLKYATKPENDEGVSSGEYKDNVIHVNLSKVRRSTVAHEVFHAVLLNKVRNNYALAKKISDDMVRVVQSKLPKNDKLRLAVENHAARYEGEIQSEEQIAELIGLLSSNIFGYTQLESSVKSAIKNYLINLAKKLRIPLPKNWGSDQEVVDLINTLARKTRTGEEITEEDVKLLDVKEDAEVDSEAKSRQQLSESESNEVSKYVEDRTIKGKKVPTFLKFKVKDKEEFLSFEGEINQENVKEIAPQSYNTTASKLSTYNNFGIDNKSMLIESIEGASVKEINKKLSENKVVIDKKILAAKKNIDKIKGKKKLSREEKKVEANQQKKIINTLREIRKIKDIVAQFELVMSIEDKVLSDSLYNSMFYKLGPKLSKLNTKELLKKSDDIYSKAKDIVKSNLLSVYNSVSPSIRKISKLWYDGANLIAQDMSSKYDITTEQAAAIIATQSPQMPWFDNLHLADVIMDTLKNRSEELFTQEMFDYYVLKAKGYESQVTYIPTLKTQVGKKLSELSNYDAGIFIRVDYDLNISRKSPIRIPTGTVVQDSQSGDSSFSGYNVIQKGVSVFRDGSMDNISNELGRANKVRNFYVNIVNPSDRRAVTIDTHAMAIALFKPLASNDIEVDFGPASFAFYADAYRELAEELGIEARALQSITWEAARAIFPATKKSEGGYKNSISKIWDKFSTKQQTLDEVQKQIYSQANDPNITEWSKYINELKNEKTRENVSGRIIRFDGAKTSDRLGDVSKSDSGLPTSRRRPVSDDTTSEKITPATRQQKTMQQVARDFNMSETGFFPKNVDSYFLKKAISKAQGDYGIKKARTGSFFLVDGRGRIVKDLFRRPTTRKQIIGENAELSENVINNYVVANQMEAAKKSAKDIRTATGWERGADGKWRYEIDDLDLITRFGDNTKIKSALRVLGKGYDIELKQLNSFSSLIKAYPKLSSLKIRLGYLSTASGAFRGNTITLSKFVYRDVIRSIETTLNRSGEFGGAYVLNDDYLSSKLKELTSTILHEVQHDIQDIEGFAKGGNTAAYSYDYYKSLAGEVEARNVETRMNMTPKQRRETLLQVTEDVAREDQIFFESTPATRQQRTDRLAPNGKQSNLTDVQYDIVRTPAFKKWFGNWETDPENASKVVDKNGEPMVIYHGTNSPEGVFERGFDKENKNLTSRNVRDRNNWFWFSNNKEVASTYGTKVLEVFVSSKDMLSKQNTNLDQLYREAVKSNKDGLVMRDVADTLSDTRYIVFDNQRHYVDDKGSTGYFADELLPSETQEEIIEQLDAQIRYYEKEIGLDKLEEYEKEELQFNLDLKDFIEKNGKDAVTITERIKGDIYGIENPTQIKLADGSNITFDPSKPSIRQQKTAKDYISEAREDNFEDEVIRDFLVRVKRFPAKKVDELLSLKVSLFDKMPSSFGNVTGGAKVGVKLYEKVERFRIQEQKRNKKRKNKLTEQEIIDKTIEFLEKQPEYINEGDKYSVGSEKKGTKKTMFRTGISSQQARMLSDIQKSIGIRPTENMGIKIAKARLALRERRKGGMDLQKVKTEVRNFLRKSLPKELYQKKEVLDLINKIAIANEKNIKNIIKEIEAFVVEVNIKSLHKKIDGVLNGKYQVVENARLKAKKISDEIRQRIEFIKSNLVSPTATPEEIGDANLKLGQRLDELSNTQQITEQQIEEMVDLQLAMQYNNAMLMDNSNPTKVTELDGIYSTLEEMIKYGRSLLKEELKAQHLYYNKQFEQGYEAITSDKVDMSDPNSKTQLNNRKKKRVSDEKRKKATQNVVRKFLSKIGRLVSVGFGSAETLDVLMDRIDKLPGEMFGGRLNEMFTDRVDESSRRFKMRMMDIESVMAGYLYEVYGKKWEKIAREHRNLKELGIELHGGIMLEMLSQDQIAYLYNMYKDPANRASFANPKMWGVEAIDKDDSASEKKRKQEINQANAARVMKELEAKLDPKVKEVADWQVEVLYPSLYEEYNNTYKKLYRTNLPWNQFYAGTIYRDGVPETEIDVMNILGQGNMYKTAVGASATKKRQGSNLPIKPMYMMDVLNTYVNDMEYFAAYGETIRDMDKFFSNQYIKDAIVDIHGSEIYTFVDDIIKKIASKGRQDSSTKAKIINSMNNAFILSRLALSPLIAVKQLTSMFTYANDIGPVNWLKYSAKNKTQQLKVWKEVTENSVYMKDRNNQSIMKALETYSEDKMKEFVPRPTKDWLLNFAMYTTKIGDRGAIMLGGLPNYSYYKAQALKQGKTEQEAIDIAIRKFEKDTKRTQQSSDLQDKDYLQTGDPLTRAMNMFLTTPKQYLRKEIVATRNLYRAVSGKAYKGTVGQNIRTFVLYHVLMPVLFQYVSMGLPGILRASRDDDDKDLIRAGVLGNLNALFLVGEMLQAISDGIAKKPWAGSQTKSVGSIQIVNSIIKDFTKASNYKDEDKKAKAMNEAFLKMATLGSPTVVKYLENYSKLDETEDVGELILRLLNYSEYQISGSSSNKSKVKTVSELNEEYQKQQEKKSKESKKKKISFYD